MGPIAVLVKQALVTRDNYASNVKQVQQMRARFAQHASALQAAATELRSPAIGAAATKLQTAARELEALQQWWLQCIKEIEDYLKRLRLSVHEVSTRLGSARMQLACMLDDINTAAEAVSLAAEGQLGYRSGAQQMQEHEDRMKMVRELSQKARIASAEKALHTLERRIGDNDPAAAVRAAESTDGKFRALRSKRAALARKRDAARKALLLDYEPGDLTVLLMACATPELERYAIDRGHYQIPSDVRALGAMEAELERMDQELRQLQPAYGEWLEQHRLRYLLADPEKRIGPAPEFFKGDQERAFLDYVPPSDRPTLPDIAFVLNGAKAFATDILAQFSAALEWVMEELKAFEALDVKLSGDGPLWRRFLRKGA